MAMYTLRVTSEFSAAHHLRGYEGRCARPHGHNYRVVVEVCATELDAVGLAVDYYAVKALLGAVIDVWDHRDLNTLPPFDTINPSAEHMAAHLYRTLSAAPLFSDVVSLRSVTLWECDDFCVRYTED